MGAHAWRTLRLAAACAAFFLPAALLVPAIGELTDPARAQSLDGLPSLGGGTGGGSDPLSELPSAEELGRTADELVRGVESASGADLPGLGGGDTSPSEPGAGTPPASPPAAPSGFGGDGFGGEPAASGAAPDGDGGGANAPGADGEAGGGAREPAAAAAGARRLRGEEIEGTSSTEPRSGSAPSPVERVVDAITEVPLAVYAAILLLAVLGLAMTGRSAVLAGLARRLRLRREELEEDVGALQRALLPELPDELAGVEISAASRAASGPAAGGDFLDVLELGDGRVGVIVGDVCGHGREALGATALVHYTVRAYLEAGLEPREALRLADAAVGSKLGGEYATVLAAVYDAPASSLTYATAGHPVPLITGLDADLAVEELTPPPIGVGPRTGFRQTCVAVPAGARICLFTDGLPETQRADGGRLGRDGLAALLGGDGPGAGADAAGVLEAIAGAEEDDREPAPDDDLTLCVLSPAGASGDGTVCEELDLGGVRSPASLREFLLACGVEEARAAELAERGGAGDDAPHDVLLRVRRNPAGAQLELADAGAERSSLRETLV